MAKNPKTEGLAARGPFENVQGPGTDRQLTPTMGLADSLPLATSPAEQAPAAVEKSDDGLPVTQPRAKQGDDGRPYCAKHNVLMKASATRGEVTHYACPAAGCMERGKRARPTLKVPTEPQLCPQRHCRGEGEALALEKNEPLSTMANLHMQCPRCNFHVKVPRPQFNAVLSKRREFESAADDLAAR